ncbi:MAG TPA: hypothetical protein VF815_31770 [Myxococcaceae bacterium]
MKTKMIVAVAALGFGTFTGCGGVEDAELSGSDAVQSVEQALCESPPTGMCEPGTVAATPAGQTCNHFGWNFTWTCMEKFPSTSGCFLWRCSSTGTWSWKKIGGDCTTATANYCS